MKHFFCFLLVLLSIPNSYPGVPATYTNEDISLELIDNICGDTWCEGDFNYIFHNASYKKSTKEYLLEFELIPDLYDSNLTFNTECSIPVQRFPSDVFYKDSSGRFELNSSFYEVLSECVTEREYEFRSILEKN